jgi:hypothetical protein
LRGPQQPLEHLGLFKVHLPQSGYERREDLGVDVVGVAASSVSPR